MPVQAPAPGAMPARPNSAAGLVLRQPAATPAQPRSGHVNPDLYVRYHRLSPSHPFSLEKCLASGCEAILLFSSAKKRQQSQLAINLTELQCAAKSILALLKITLTWVEIVLPVQNMLSLLLLTCSSPCVCVRIPPMQLACPCPCRLNGFPGRCPSPWLLTLTAQSSAQKNIPTPAARVRTPGHRRECAPK